MQYRALIVGIVLACTTALIPPTPSGAAPPPKATVELKLPGQTLIGRPLAWSKKEIHLLDRSGWVHECSPDKVVSYKAISNRFTPYTPSEFRAVLLKRLGNDYRVTGTTHYLVAHPRDMGAEWAERFERLYRSFVHYFSVRGFRLKQPEFLMTGIVCRDLKEFYQYSQNAENIAPGAFEGYYSLVSNRIALYRRSASGGGKGLDPAIHSIIIHEATHQMAYNTGIHSRYCPPPIWVAEGLATSFEARGVYDSSKYRTRKDRINRKRFENYRDYILPQQSPELLQTMVVSDELFRSNPMAAYALAWSYTFYLLETHPHQYAEYMVATASGEPFTRKTPKERLADFTKVFGSDWRFLNAKFVRFMKEIK